MSRTSLIRFVNTMNEEYEVYEQGNDHFVHFTPKDPMTCGNPFGEQKQPQTIKLTPTLYSEIETTSNDLLNDTTKHSQADFREMGQTILTVGTTTVFLLSGEHQPLQQLLENYSITTNNNNTNGNASSSSSSNCIIA